MDHSTKLVYVEDCLDDASRLAEAQGTFIRCTLVGILDFPPDSVLQLLSLCDEPMTDREAAEFRRLWADDLYESTAPKQLSWAQAAKIIQDLLVEPDLADTEAQYDAIERAMPNGPAAVLEALEPWRPKGRPKRAERLPKLPKPSRKVN